MCELTQKANVLVSELAENLLSRKYSMACAESCTGGWLAKVCTDLAGSSLWFDRGFVTYSNAAKIQMLGVDARLIRQFGAVSEQVAEAMVSGVLHSSDAQIAAAITGIAGPDGGTLEKPVGTVCFAWAIVDCPVTVERKRFSGDRQQVRLQAVIYVLSKLVGITGGAVGG